MDRAIEVFNIYSDETRVENPEAQKMVIGALIIPRRKRDILAEDIEGLRAQYNFNYELKWTKTSGQHLAFYKALLDYFFSKETLNFRCIIVDKSSLDYGKYHNDDKELAFFKFYYFMLKQKLLDFKRYYIFLDKKPTRDKNMARALHSYLESYILLHKKQCSIAHLQAYHSHENLFLQLADYLTGLVGYAVNSGKQGSVKSEMVKYFKEKIGRVELSKSSPLSEEKFNVFVWKGNDA
jgi:hypothetical protein